MFWVPGVNSAGHVPTWWQSWLALIPPEEVSGFMFLIGNGGH